MKTNFANGREKLNQEDWKIEKFSNSGNLSAQNIYFSLQAENQYGRNYLIKSKKISISDNDSIKIKIKPTANKEGENWINFIIGFSSNNNNENFIQIAKIKKPKNFDKSQEIELTKDEIFNDNLIINDINSFPSNPFHGTIVNINGTNDFYEFNKNIIPYEYNNEFIKGNNGTWIKVDNALCYIYDITEKYGAKRDISQIKKMPNNKINNYDLKNEESDELLFYLEHKNKNKINENRYISISTLINNIDVTAYLDNQIKYKIYGYVKEDYTLRKYRNDDGRLIKHIGKEILYNQENPIRLRERLKGNEKILIGIKIEISANDLESKIPDNSDFSLNFNLIANGRKKNPLGSILGGNAILSNKNAEYKNMRIYPKEDNEILIESGKAIINEFDVTKSEETSIRTIPENEKEIHILIDQFGNFEQSNSFSSIKPTRAIVSTKQKESFISEFKSKIVSLNANQYLEYTIDFEKTEDDKKQLNPNYKDVISKSDRYFGFSFSSINIYFKINQYDNKDEIVKSKFYKKSNITALDKENTIKSLRLENLEEINEDDIPYNNESLFHPGKVKYFKTPNISSNNNILKNLKQYFSADSIEINIAFSLIYDGSIISDITHNTEDGAMPEINTNIFDFIQNQQYWNSPISEKEVKKISHYNLKSGMERKILVNEEYIDYIYKDDVKNVENEIKPENKLDSEKGRWIPKYPEKDTKVELEKKVKKEIYKNSIIFGS